MDFKRKWQFVAKCLIGLDGASIDKFPRERDNKYSNRQNLSYYINHIKPKCSLFIGYMTKFKPMRTIENDLQNALLENADFRNNSLDKFLSAFFENAKARGCNLLLIDMPKEIPTNLKEQLRIRALPYLVEVLPETVFDYSLDSFGALEWVLIEAQTSDKTPFSTETNKTIYRYYDKNNWRLYNSEKIVIDSGEHLLGVCPILIFSENGTFPSIGDFTQIADLSKRLMNLYSELDEMLRGQTFSLLAMKKPIDGSGIDKITISTDNALFFDDTAPVFIAPPSTPAEMYQMQISKIENLIQKISYSSVNDNVESGIAKEYKFQELNNALSSFSQRTEDFERNIWDIVCKWLKIENNVLVSYNTDFNIKDLKTEIETATAMMDLNLGSVYNLEKKKQLIVLDLEGIENDKKTEIFNELATL